MCFYKYVSGEVKRSCRSWQKVVDCVEIESSGFFHKDKKNNLASNIDAFLKTSTSFAFPSTIHLESLKGENKQQVFSTTNTNITIRFMRKTLIWLPQRNVLFIGTFYYVCISLWISKSSHIRKQILNLLANFANWLRALWCRRHEQVHLV